MPEELASRAWGRRLFVFCLFFLVLCGGCSSSRETLASRHKSLDAGESGAFPVGTNNAVAQAGRRLAASPVSSPAPPPPAATRGDEGQETLVWRMVEFKERHIKKLLEFFKKTPDYPYAMTPETLRELMQKPLFKDLSFVAVKIKGPGDDSASTAKRKASVSEGEEELVGALFAYKEEDDVALHTIFTVPEYRGFGVAPKMLEMLEELANHFRENGYPNIRRICADAAVDNPKVLINLKKLGFSIESHTKDAFAAGRHAGYSLFKELTPRIIKSLEEEVRNLHEIEEQEIAKVQPALLESAKLPEYSKIRLTSYLLAGNDVRQQVRQVIDDAVFESLTGEPMTLTEFLADDPYFCDFSPLDFVRNSSQFFIIAVDDETLDVKGMLLPLHSTVNGIFKDFRVYADGMKTMSLLFEGMLNAAQSARHPTLEVEIPSDDVEMVELFTSLGFLKLRAMAPIKSQVYKLSLRAEIPFRPLESYRLTRTKLSLEEEVKIAIERIDRLRLVKKMKYIKVRDVDQKLQSLKKKRDEMEHRRELAASATAAARKRKKPEDAEPSSEEKSPDKQQSADDAPSPLFHLQPPSATRTEHSEMYRLKESRMQFIKGIALRTAETMLVAAIFFFTLSWLLMLKKRQERIGKEAHAHGASKPRARIRFRLGDQTNVPLPDLSDYEEVAVVEGDDVPGQVEEIVQVLEKRHEEEEEARRS